MLPATIRTLPTAISCIEGLRQAFFPRAAALEAHGHCGRDEPEFTWEHTDKAAARKTDAGIK